MSKNPESRPHNEQEVSYQYELLRKGIHLLSLSIPIIYYYLPKNLTLYILIPLTAVFLFSDLLRLYYKPAYRLYTRIFGRMLRKHEKTTKKTNLTGATWVLISATVCVLVFPKLITITAFAILIISDTVAALVGRQFGTKRFNNKSMEGTAAFILSAIAVVFLTPKVIHAPGEYVIAAVAAVLGAIAEVFSVNVTDDNFAVPVTIAIALWILYAIFFPGLNVYILES